mmetsp:Transcript_73914/g.230357  ORF Transcript_73914/g.230357 Transcript_73914/m.230357 type:complete len:83 (-) Transcript_73914:180-428(-)
MLADKLAVVLVVLAVLETVVVDVGEATFDMQPTPATMPVGLVGGAAVNEPLLWTQLVTCLCCVGTGCGCCPACETCCADCCG